MKRGSLSLSPARRTMWHPLARESDRSKVRPLIFSASLIVMPDSIGPYPRIETSHGSEDDARWHAATRSSQNKGRIDRVIARVMVLAQGQDGRVPESTSVR